MVEKKEDIKIPVREGAVEEEKPTAPEVPKREEAEVGRRKIEPRAGKIQPILPTEGEVRRRWEDISRVKKEKRAEGAEKVEEVTRAVEAEIPEGDISELVAETSRLSLNPAADDQQEQAAELEKAVEGGKEG